MIPAGSPGLGGRRQAYLGLFGALVILALKFGAYLLTGSVGFLSDAAESVVNLVAAVLLIVALAIATSPPDYRHPYGHTRAEYLSSVVEGALILVAALAIGASAVQRLLHPQALQHVALGAAVSLAAAAVNGALAALLFRAGRQLRSAALEANARHILTDVWTSVGVIVAVVLVPLTGWQALDPIIGLAVAANIVRVGIRLMGRSLSSLLDERLPDEEEAVILSILDGRQEILGYHRLRTRSAGRARFAEVDVFVDPGMSVRAAHRLVAAVEAEIHRRLGQVVTTVHVEPFEKGVRDEPRTPREEFADEAP